MGFNFDRKSALYCRVGTLTRVLPYKVNFLQMRVKAAPGRSRIIDPSMLAKRNLTFPI